MTHVEQTNPAWELGPITIRALSSLTREHAAAISQAVQSVGPEWVVDQGDDYEGYLWLLVSPKDEQPDDVSFLISGKLGDVELAQMHTDELRTLGRFQTIQEMLPTLTRQLTSH